MKTFLLKHYNTKKTTTTKTQQQKKTERNDKYTFIKYIYYCIDIRGMGIETSISFYNHGV
jgi:hypothetical protein